MKSLFLILFSTLTFAQSNMLLVMGDDSPYEAETLAYQKRVLADGGEIINIGYLDSCIANGKANGWLDTLTIGISAEFGIKKDANNKVVKLYNIIGSIDLIATDTSNSPLYSSAFINGKPGLDFKDGVTTDWMRTNDDSTASSNYKTAKITAILIASQTLDGVFVIGVPNISGAHTSPYARWNIFAKAPVQLRIDASSVDATGSNIATIKIISYLTELRDYYENGSLVFNGTGATVTYPNATRFHLAANGAYDEIGDLNLGTLFLFGGTIGNINRGNIETLINNHYDLY